MQNTNFKYEIEAVLDDIENRLNVIDEEMSSIDEKVKLDLIDISRSELISLDDAQFEEFKTKHQEYLKELRERPLRKAKLKLNRLYSDVKTTLDGLTMSSLTM